MANENRLIVLEDTLAALNSEGISKNMRAYRKVAALPTVDAVEVVQGKNQTTAPTAVQRWMVMGMYESPIRFLEQQMQAQLEGTILRAVQNVGVDVDKDELIRALRYDRGQYEAGYLAGMETAKPEWIPVTEWLPVDEQDRVLVATDYDCPFGNQKIDTDRYRNGGWVRYGDHVTHWMPLPEPPRE